MSIPLPPLPALAESAVYVWVRHESGRYDSLPTDILALLRARDQEIVRCVLEAAAKMIERWGDSHGEGVTVNASNMGRKLANNTRALEFTHHE